MRRPESVTYSPTSGSNASRVAAVAASTSPDRPTWGDVFDEGVPMIGDPAFFGPPVIFVLGPWLLLVLLLIGPLALILTLVLALALAGTLLAMVATVIASPYLLIRHLHAHGAVRVKPRAPARLFPKHPVSSGRLSSPHPKGVS